MGEPIKLTKLDIKVLKKFRQLGFINEVAVRDYDLKKEYRRRLKEYPHLRKYEIKEQLAQENNLSIDNINFIIDRNRKRKNNPIILEQYTNEKQEAGS